MATYRIIAAHLRRRTPLSLHRTFSLYNLTSPPPPPPSIHRSSPISAASFTPSFRFYSSHSPDSVLNHDMNSLTESELSNLGFTDGGVDVSAAVTAAASEGVLLEDSIFPIRAIVSLLDGYHDVTGLPWWIVIATSTVALRITLLPLLILQLRKLKQIGEAFPKLPPPMPPPGKSYMAHFAHFRRERKALGCPSFLWFIAIHSVQIPCFILWMISIRRMSLNGFPGFDTGGILWFQDLTQSSSGILGSILPFLVAGLHLCNIQVAFRRSSFDKQTGILQLLAQWYRKYLQLLTIPILFGAFYVPQGSLIYWVTNSFLSLVQQVCLQNPAVRQSLGLVSKEALPALEKSEKDENAIIDAPTKKGPTSAFDLPALELVHLAVTYLSTGKEEKAVRLLRLAVEKDPDCYKAWTVLGHVMVQKVNFSEASEYAETAISKICLLDEPYKVEAVDFLIQAYMIAGGALYRQGKPTEALVHLEKLRDMKEPEDPVAQARYYEGLVVFACIAHAEGRKDEATQYLRKAIAFDPQYSVILENLNPKTVADDFVDDLASSRRADY